MSHGWNLFLQFENFYQIANVFVTTYTNLEYDF